MSTTRVRITALLATALMTVTCAIVNLTPSASAATLVRPGDVDGDDYPGIVSGSPAATVSGHVGSGVIAVAAGSPSGVDPAKHWVISQNSPGIGGVAETDDEFGASVVTADLDRDGYADVAVGSPGEDFNGMTDVGDVTVIWGGPDGLSDNADVITRLKPAAGDRFGASMAVGDVNGDGWPNLVVTAPGSNVFNGYTWGGSLLAPRIKAARSHPLTETGHVRREARATADDSTPAQDETLLVSTGDLTGDGVSDAAFVWYAPDAPNPYGIATYLGSAEWLSSPEHGSLASLPTSVAIGDTDADGHADVLVGMPYAKVGPVTNTGAVARYAGTPDGVDLSDPATYSQASAGFPGVNETGDHFGYGIATGDLDGDALADVIIGTPGENGASGGVTVAYGQRGGTLGRPDGFTESTRGVPGSAENGDEFGETVATVDADADEYVDTVIGDPHENRNRGAIVVLPGSTTGPTTNGDAHYGPAALDMTASNPYLGRILAP